MIRSFEGDLPQIHQSAFIHDSAEIIGRVKIAKEASIWPGSVLRGDIDKIVIEEGANIQDLSVIHTREGHPTIVGPGVTVGHRVILHGCRIGRQTLVGMGAIIMESTIGPRCLIGAGALITAGMKFPEGVLILGSPAKVIRKLNTDELLMLSRSEKSYRLLAKRHREKERPMFLGK